MKKLLTALGVILSTSLPALAQELTLADLPPATVGIKSLSADLSGAAEVPGPGAAGGRGTAFVVINPNAGRLCFALDLDNMPLPTSAHIHEGAAGTSGSPVIDLNVTSSRFGGCVTDVDSKLLIHIALTPANFYVNVHTNEFPAGAVRGQLSD